MASVTDEEDLVAVVGYKFHPTDEELVNHYLKLKNQGGQEHDVRAITVVNVCKSEPWDLPGQSKIRSEDLWYFFSRRDYKYEKSKRFNRTTDAGYWKLSGNPRKVMAKRNKKQIGTKRTLVFYEGRPPGIRTGWVMHQYERAPDSNLQDQGEFILCKLKRKSNEKAGKGKPNHCTMLASDFQNQDPTEVANNLVCDEHEPAHHIAYDAENECPNDVTATSTDANGDTSCSMASDCENQVFVPGEGTPPMVTDFENQSPYTGGDCLLLSGFENLPTCGQGECPPVLTLTDSIQSPYEKCDWLLVSDSENQISACGEGLLPHTTMYFDFKNESPYFEGDSLMTSGYKNQISAWGEGELPPLVISSDFRSESPYEKGDCQYTSDFGNQLLDIDFEEGAWSPPPVAAPSDFEDLSIYDKEVCPKTSYLGYKISDYESEEGQQINHVLVPSTFNKGEPKSLVAQDFRKINSYDKTNISVSEEGEASSLKMSPSDFASQNQFQNIDMKDLERVNWDFLTDLDVQTPFAEFEPEPMANLAAELQCTLSSDLQGPKFSDEIPCYGG